MERYKNLSGKSGVAAYEITDNSIKVKFINGGVYLYSNLCPVRRSVDKMKVLATRGLGLSTYISQYIKEDYASILIRPKTSYKRPVRPQRTRRSRRW